MVEIDPIVAAHNKYAFAEPFSWYLNCCHSKDMANVLVTEGQWIALRGSDGLHTVLQAQKGSTGRIMKAVVRGQDFVGVPYGAVFELDLSSGGLKRRERSVSVKYIEDGILNETELEVADFDDSRAVPAVGSDAGTSVGIPDSTPSVSMQRLVDGTRAAE